MDNTYDGEGNTRNHTQKNTLDVCDPQLTVFPDGTIYCGMAAGGGNIQTSYSNFRLWKSTDNGETWEEDEHSSASNVRTDTFFHKWMKNIAASGQFKTGITTPGHGIVLGKDVPNSPLFKQGQVVMPIFLNGTPSGTNYFHIKDRGGMYLATGLAADPFDWDTSNFYKTYTKWDNTHQEESQVCQLDDGSLLMYGKNWTNDQFSRYRDDKWEILTSSITGGQNCQAGLLKVADGNGGGKYGVVAFSYSGNAAANAKGLEQGAGRGNITICFARDISTENATGFPLDEKEPYYLKIRTKSQSYFGYTDMVMIDENTLGIIYETYDREQDVDGMRFLRINVGPIIRKLSTRS
ncbi:MAG: exo-alpha-sialidase [Spirochaetaceae bacterium]|nr:exo-alpha-sialidase [Spirochaetaceae bacterium]